MKASDVDGEVRKVCCQYLDFKTSLPRLNCIRHSLDFQLYRTLFHKTLYIFYYVGQLIQEHVIFSNILELPYCIYVDIYRQHS